MLAETGPKPLAPEQTRYVRVLMSDSRVEPIRYFGQTETSTFWQNGVYQADPSWYKVRFGSPDKYWTQNLLKYNPEDTRVKTSRQGNLLVLKDPNYLMETIYPEKIRRVNKISEFTGVVSPSGYLLSRGFGPSRDTFRLEGVNFSLDEYDQILREADEGIKPPGVFWEPFMKVDPSLAGTKLWQVWFDYHPPIGSWRDPDGVVIDPQTKSLIPRTISWPLDPYKWDPDFEEKLKARIG